MTTNIDYTIDTLSKYAGSNRRMDGPFRIMCIDAIRSTITAQHTQIEDMRQRIEALEEALDKLVYFYRGEWYVGMHGDARVTDIVDDLLEEDK